MTDAILRALHEGGSMTAAQVARSINADLGPTQDALRALDEADTVFMRGGKYWLSAAAQNRMKVETQAETITRLRRELAEVERRAETLQGMVDWFRKQREDDNPKARAEQVFK